MRCFVPLMHFCIGKYQSVPRLLAMIVVTDNFLIIMFGWDEDIII